LFFAPDADAIIGIPLRHNGGEDFLAWAHEKSGIYSVRSAYRAIVTKGQADDMARSDAPPSSSTTDVWKRLWKLCVIPKVRVFWWRVLRGILPDYGTLTRRHVRADSTCGICKAKSESMFHALIECSHAHMFWAAAKDILLVKLPRLHPITWARDILCGSLVPEKDIARIISVMYTIWTSRNKVTHGEAVFNPSKSMEFILEAMDTLELPKEQRSAKPLRPACTWHGPPEGFTKINSDGGIQVDLNLAASRVVARDATGFCGAMCKTYTGISDPITIEALALRDAFMYAKGRGFTHVICEVDCAELVKCWQKGEVDRSVIRPILEEIRDISLSFISCNVVSVRREANQVAHCCAKFVQEESFTWNVEPPVFLVHSLSADCNPAM
jgi:hypothetical protein